MPGIKTDFMKDYKIKFGKCFKGHLALLVAMEDLHFSYEQTPICQYLKKGEVEKVIKMIKETNKHEKEASMVRFGLMTVLHEVLKNDTRITISEFTWYLRIYLKTYLN